MWSLLLWEDGEKKEPWIQSSSRKRHPGSQEDTGIVNDKPVEKELVFQDNIELWCLCVRFQRDKRLHKACGISMDGQRGYCDRPIAMVIWMMRISGPQWIESFQNHWNNFTGAWTLKRVKSQGRNGRCKFQVKNWRGPRYHYTGGRKIVKFTLTFYQLAHLSLEMKV